jgi:hypothetical protein
MKIDSSRDRTLRRDCFGYIANVPLLKNLKISCEKPQDRSGQNGIIGKLEMGSTAERRASQLKTEIWELIRFYLIQT